MNRLMHRAALALCTAALLSGCYRINYSTGRAPNTKVMPENTTEHMGIFGLVNFSDPVELNSICPEGFAKVEQKVTFAYGLVSAITFGLYNPHRVTVQCASGTAFDVKLTNEGLARSAKRLE